MHLLTFQNFLNGGPCSEFAWTVTNSVAGNLLAVSVTGRMVLTKVLLVVQARLLSACGNMLLLPARVPALWWT